MGAGRQSGIREIPGLRAPIRTRILAGGRQTDFARSYRMDRDPRLGDRRWRAFERRSGLVGAAYPGPAPDVAEEPPRDSGGFRPTGRDWPPRDEPPLPALQR